MKNKDSAMRNRKKKNIHTIKYMDSDKKGFAP